MIKKSTGNKRKSQFSAAEFAAGGKKRLGIKQIRSFSEELAALPDGARMPDWSRLTIGDRLGIAVRLIPKDMRRELLGITDYQFARYASGHHR